MHDYAAIFLKKEYGDQALRILDAIEIKALNSYDFGGVSEVTETDIKIAAKRDIDAGKLTNTTKLIIRHELGHILDDNPEGFEFDEQIEREKQAWVNAKLKTPAEQWFKNISIRTHIDPLKIAAMGFPRPEMKIPHKLLNKGTESELKRMKKDSPSPDRNLAERFAMVNLIENSTYYS